MAGAGRDIQFTLFDINTQGADRGRIQHDPALLADDLKLIAEQRAFFSERQQGDAALPVMRGDRGLLIVILHGEMTHGGSIRDHGQRRPAKRKQDAGRDQAHIVGIGNGIVMLKEQDAAIGQAKADHALGRVSSCGGGDGHPGGQRQINGFSDRACCGIEKDHLAGGGDAQAQLALLLQRIQQGGGAGVSRNRIGGDRRHRGRLKHGDHDIQQIKGNEHNGDNHADTAERHQVTGRHILHAAPLPIAPGGLRTEIGQQRAVSHFFFIHGASLQADCDVFIKSADRRQGC